VKINNDPEMNKKKGETTNLQPSGNTINTNYLGKFNHISSENKNLASDEHPNNQINGALGKFKRRQANLSSDQFLNFNNAK
jgi:hypothetical protein